MVRVMSCEDARLGQPLAYSGRRMLREDHLFDHQATHAVTDENNGLLIADESRSVASTPTVTHIGTILYVR